MDESIRWADIPGYPGYQASDTGLIRVLRTRHHGPAYWHLVGQSKLKSGHILVSVKDDTGKACRRYVHRLVLTAFVGEPTEGMFACHYDDDPANNRLDNLRWDTPAGNGRDHSRTTRTGKPLKVSPIAIRADWDDNTVRLAQRHNTLLTEIHQLHTRRLALIHELDDIAHKIKHES